MLRCFAASLPGTQTSDPLSPQGAYQQNTNSTILYAYQVGIRRQFWFSCIRGGHQDKKSSDASPLVHHTCACASTLRPKASTCTSTSSVNLLRYAVAPDFLKRERACWLGGLSSRELIDPASPAPADALTVLGILEQTAAGQTSIPACCSSTVKGKHTGVRLAGLARSFSWLRSSRTTKAPYKAGG